jgi:hypothetical protein
MSAGTVAFTQVAPSEEAYGVTALAGSFTSCKGFLLTSTTAAELAAADPTIALPVHGTEAWLHELPSVE